MCERHLTDEERAHRPAGPVTFVDELVVALTNARIYSEDHPRLRAAVEALDEGLRALLAEEGEQGLRLGAADGRIFHAGRPLLGATLTSRRLVDLLDGVEAGGLAFARRTTAGDLRAFLRFAAREARDVADVVEANRALDAAGCTAIRFLPPYREATGSWEERMEHGAAEAKAPDATALEEAELAGELQIPVRLYQGVVETLQGSMIDACRGKHLDLAGALGDVEAILGQLARDTGSMMRLARYEKYDAFTFGHSIRVCFLALNFARHLTDDRALLQRVGLAALMHDIGKAWVPFEVLNSTKRLSEEERREMNRHPVHGGQILLDGTAPDPLVVAAAFGHHQTPDGGGYPRSLRAGPPTAATMIVKICDVYEALTAVRPYKPRMSPVRAYRIMMDMDGHFDPVLLRRFIEVNGIHPVGTRVRLDTGEIGRVTRLTDSPLEPIVRTETAACGEGLFYEDVQDLDLRERFGRNRVRIEEVLLDAEL